MPSPGRSFFYVFVIMCLFGLLVGMLNVHNPDAVHIPFGVDENGTAQSAEGLDGILAATLSAGVLGIVFGSLAALLAWLFGLGFREKETVAKSDMN